MTQTIKIGLEINDKGTLQVNSKQAASLRKQLEEGNKAAVLLSKGISDPTKKKALEEQVAAAKKLSSELNNINAQSRATAKALSVLNTGGVASGNTPEGLLRGTAAVNARGGSRDFARQAQGMGGLVHLYATFAANIWSVQAAYMALSSAFEQSRMEKAAEMMSSTIGINMKNLASDIREVSGYAVDFKDAMQFGALGTQAGLTTKQITELVKAAKGAANVLGRDVNDSINRMIRGTAKMEQEILDELGIFVRANDAYEKYAKKLGLSGKEALTQSERVKAYAEAVSEASEKYKEFAEIQDPFSKLAARVKDAGRDLLNMVNSVISPFINSLAESGKLVEGMLVAGVAYLTKLAVPALKNFSAALFDTSALVQKAKIARENEIASVTAQLENLKHANQTIDFSRVGKGLAGSINVALSDGSVTKAISTAMNKGTVDFEKNLSKSLQSASRGFLGQAAKAAAAGDTAAQQKWIQQAQLISSHEDAIIKKVQQRIAADAELASLMNKQSLTLQEQIQLETRLLALQKETSLETSAGRRAARGEASNTLANKITAGGVAGIFTLEAFKGLPDIFSKATEAMGSFGKALVIVETGIKIFAKALTGLFAAFNWILMAWMAWDLAIMPLLKKLGVLTDASEKYQNSLIALTESSETYISTIEKSNKVLQERESTIDDKIKATNALSNANMELAEAIALATLNYTKYLAEATPGDLAIDTIKGTFGFGAMEAQKEAISTALKAGQVGGIITQADVDKFKEISGEMEMLAQKTSFWASTWILIKDIVGGVLGFLTEGAGLFLTKLNEAANALIWLGTLGQVNLIEKAKERAKADADAARALQQQLTDQLTLLQKRAQAEAAYQTLVARQLGLQKEISSTFKPVQQVWGGEKNPYKFSNAEIGASVETTSAAIYSAKAGAFNSKEVVESSTAIGLLTQEIDGLKNVVKDPQFLPALLELSIVLATIAKYQKEGDVAGLESFKTNSKARIDAAIAGYRKFAEATDERGKPSNKGPSAAAEEFLRQRQAILKKMADWEENVQERRLTRMKEEQQLLTSRQKLTQDTALYTSKAEQEILDIKAKEIILQEQSIQLSKLNSERADAEKKIKPGTAEHSKLTAMYRQQEDIIRETTNIKLEEADIQALLNERVRARTQYEKTITAELERQRTIQNAVLESDFAQGKISPEEYEQSKYQDKLAKFKEERDSIMKQAETAGFSQVGLDNNADIRAKFAESQFAEKLKALGISEAEAAIEFEKIKNLREQEKILGTISNAVDQMTTSLERQEGKGIFNTELLDQITNAKLAKIDYQMSSTKDVLQLQTLELEKQNLLYDSMEKKLEYMKKNFLELDTDQKMAVVLDEATKQVERFRAGMKDLVTGTFDAVYSGFDAAIDELTTKMMEDVDFSFKEIVTTLRNTMAEQFRQMAAEQMKLGVRQLGESILKSIMPESASSILESMKSPAEKQVDLLTEIRDILMGKSVPGLSNPAESELFDASAGPSFMDGKEISGSIYEAQEASMNAAKSMGGVGEAAEAAAEQTSTSITGMLGEFGTTVLGVFKGIGGGIMGFLQPLLSLLGIGGIGGGGAGGGLGMLGGLGSLLSGGLGNFGSSLGGLLGDGMTGWSGMVSGSGLLGGTMEWLGSFLPFAKGGIMSQYGPVQLQKYSKGGIADRPQLALYGEGSKNEAYVPLPDNRSIPVTLNGAGRSSDNVAFNITINDNSTTEGTDKEGTKKDKEQGYKEFSKLISQKVREEMVQQKRPGGLLYG